MSEQKLEVFNVLNFLNSGYELEDILNEGNFGTFESGEDCINYLVEEGYLEGDVSVNVDVEITAEAISKKYIVSNVIFPLYLGTETSIFTSRLDFGRYKL